jgi:hypothetical protein
MVRSAFFSFHYDRDVWCSDVARDGSVTQEREAAGLSGASFYR